MCSNVTLMKKNNAAVSHSATNPGSVELARARALLQRADLRATTPRLIVLQLLFHQRRPLSHAEVARALQDQGLDQATVFRNLNDLAEAAILSRVDVGDHTWRFEPRSGGNDLSEDRHSHFVCERCSSVSCLNDFSASALPRTHAFGAIVASVSEVVLRGCCRQC
jgi:Fur family transcriptional regulator, ferric uptake regulator